MIVEDLGSMPYHQAWRQQEAVHEQVAGGAEEHLLLVEHPSVVTFGRRPGQERHLRQPETALAEMGVELVQSDRGGDITFHGPGQIVAYPIIRLADHALSISGYVRRLEQVAIDTLAAFELKGERDPAAPGVWVRYGQTLAKVCAVGVRIRRGVTLHGIALNVETDLSYFDLIVPCGLVGRRATSMRELLGDQCPPLTQVKVEMIKRFRSAFVHQQATEPRAK